MAQQVRSRGKKVEMTPEERDRIVKLHKQGKGYTKISEETGYSRWTVSVVLKEAGISPGAPSGRNGASGVQTAPMETRPREEKVEPTPGSTQVRTEPERRVSRRKEGPLGLSAAELAAQISTAEQEARRYAREITEYADELSKLWERAEYLSNYEEALAEAVAALRVMKERADRYKRQLDEIQQQSLQKSMAIHSESKSLTRE